MGKKLFEYIEPGETRRLFTNIEQEVENEECEGKPKKTQENNQGETQYTEAPGMVVQDHAATNGFSCEKRTLRDSGLPSMEQIVDVYAALQKGIAHSNYKDRDNSYMPMTCGYTGATNIEGKRNCGDAEEFVFHNGKLIGIVNGKEVLMGNFRIQIFSEIERRREICDETNEIIRVESERFLKLGIFTERDQYLGEIRQEDLYKFQWILRLSDNRAYYEDGGAVKRMLKKYLHKLILSEEFSKFVEFASTGWKEADGAFYYVTSDGVVGHPEMQVKSCDGFSFFNRKVQKIAPDKAIRDYLDMWQIMPQKPGNVTVMRNYTLMSSMTTIFSKAGYSPKFILAVIGKTNSKKTSCAKAICKLFNRKPDMGVDINFNSTDAAIYDIMERHSDASVLVDDFVPPENAAEAKILQNKLEIIERAYGDRSPRKRCVTFAKNKDAKQFCPVKGCAVITGETFGGRKSSQSRAIQVHFEEGDVDEDVLAYYQQHLEVLPTVAEGFILFVEKNIQYVMETVEAEVLFWRKELKNSIETPRFKEDFAMLAATEKIFGSFLKDQGWFTDEYIDRMMQVEIDQIFGIIRENDENLRFCDPFTPIVEAVRYSLEKNRLELVRIDEAENNGQLKTVLIETPEYFLITADKLYECVKEYFAFTGRFFNCKSSRELVCVLAQEGAVLERKEGEKNRRTHKIALNGKTINNRFLHIFKHKMKCIIEFIENI